jgi:hypothetical protein
VGGIVLALVAASAHAAIGGSPSGPLSGGQFEANVSNDPQTNNGEPSVAANPLDHNNVIVTYMQNTQLYDVEHQRTPTISHLVSSSSWCGYAVTRDGGNSWVRRMLPINDPPVNDPNLCEDSLVVFTRDGTAYASATTVPAVAGGAAFEASDSIRVMKSVDGGATWSAPVTAIPVTLTPGNSPIPTDPTDPSRPIMSWFVDRHWMVVDDSTGIVYVSGQINWLGADALYHHVFVMTASLDGGATWSPLTIYNEPVPTAGRSTQLAGLSMTPVPSAAHGGVAVAYVPVSTPAAAAECTCVMFAVSTDGAATFVKHPTPIPSDINGFPDTAADASRPGHFTVMVVDASGEQLSVYRTDDWGLSWSGPVALGEEPLSPRSKPWIASSPSGVVGVGWVTVNADKSFDYWAAISRDAGSTFDAPVRLSSAASPAVDPLLIAGNDTTSVWLSSSELYAAWGDMRSGHLDVWWAGFPLAEMSTGRAH